MSVRAGSYSFPEVHWDPGADVLELAISDGGSVAGAESPEGHLWMYPDDDSNEVTGLVLMAVHALLERDGEITVTTPQGEKVVVEGLGAALKQPA
jgi:hypothetical protein